MGRSESMKGNRHAAGRGAKYPIPLRSRCSAEEMEIIRENAAKADMSVCAYVRMRAVGHHISSRVDVKALSEITDFRMEICTPAPRPVRREAAGVSRKSHFRLTISH